MNQEEQILDTYRIVAVVGLSPDAERPSFRVASYLKAQGYRIIPVNPRLSQVLGETCYPELTSIPEPVEVVDIFRRAEEAPAIVDQAIAVGARAVWMQEGIVNEAAARKAREAGLLVVMDRCMRKEHLKATEKKSGGR
ncbi:MAG: CoA-binding protein [Chloroflexi bacterium]|nr:CoA-binding protein [Chloroflexota bacterium]